MKRFDLSLKQETINIIKERADNLYGGNASLCARVLIEKALKDSFPDFDGLAEKINRMPVSADTSNATVIFKLGKKDVD